MTEFTANFGYMQDDGAIQMVGLADDQLETRAYVLLQKTCNPTADDVALGHDQIHTTVGGEQHAAYGGIEAIELFEDRLRFAVKPATACLLGTDDEIIIRFGTQIESLDRIVTTLGSMAGSLLSDRRPKMNPRSDE